MKIACAECLRRIYLYRHLLTKQQVTTLRGQVLAGDIDAAMKGLDKLVYRNAHDGRSGYAEKAKATL